MRQNKESLSPALATLQGSGTEAYPDPSSNFSADPDPDSRLTLTLTHTFVLTLRLAEDLSGIIRGGLEELRAEAEQGFTLVQIQTLTIVATITTPKTISTSPSHHHNGYGDHNHIQKQKLYPQP